MDIFELVAEMRHQEGVQEGTEKSVRILLANTEFSIAKIGSLTEVPVSLVKKLSKGIRSK